MTGVVEVEVSEWVDGWLQRVRLAGGVFGVGDLEREESSP